MKAKVSLILVLMTAISVVSSSQTKSEVDSALPNPADSLTDRGDTNGPADPAAPESQHVLQQYDVAMVAITQNFYARLAGITEAVEQGKMNREEGKTSTAEQYLIAQMQFQLLSAWRQMDEQDLARVPAPDDKSEASPRDDSEIVLVELPFSSFQLTAAVAEHLSLTQLQKEAIQQVMARERHLMEPLMAQSRSIRDKLLEIDPQHSTKKEIKTLADAEAALLARVIVANARMQSEIYKLLTPEQRRKLDELKRSGQPETVASR
jgi:LTXXQ motif family protein